tara:strand:+ start:40 stop:798 length:759 start_codon:yes stop_codon:yes gene_type:complete
MTNENKKLEIYKVIDKNEKHYTEKSPLSSLPAKIIIVGKSQMSGKSSVLINLFFRKEKEFYGSDFDGKNIFVISRTAHQDYKMRTFITQKEIPETNVFTEFDEELIEGIYELIEQEYMSKIEEGKCPHNFLWLFDDMSSSNIFKHHQNDGIINKIFSQGRHTMQSCCLTSQKYSSIGNLQRENITMGIFFACSEKQLDLITEDINMLTDKATFKRKFREATENPHSFFVVNFTAKDKRYRYMDSNFEPIDFK